MKLQESNGNMYPWVTHMHTHLGGECPHKCKYCYVETGRFGRAPRYTGPLRLIEDEFKVAYGSGKTIFIEHKNDLFAENVPALFIRRIMAHCQTWPDNTYVFQTKNPGRYFGVETLLPRNCILGVTIETNRVIPGISEAPPPEERAKQMIMLRLHACRNVRLFVTIEPVLDFDVDILAAWIHQIRPDFLNLGADSKHNGLPEPTVEKIMALVAKLHEWGIELREKHNLQRLKER